ncbi:hypothetical protein CK203_006970 [Vitis vinifera]|uniref:Uncharacterized protein n=1 Tax=Vitis vinifera TaxID=29760 RepID=A0A438KCI7_VITVI|nr:hypothetical protein CK203_006970 [Vitis vinifera]
MSVDLAANIHAQGVRGGAGKCYLPFQFPLPLGSTPTRRELWREGPMLEDMQQDLFLTKKELKTSAIGMTVVAVAAVAVMLPPSQLSCFQRSSGLLWFLHLRVRCEYNLMSIVFAPSLHLRALIGFC